MFISVALIVVAALTSGVLIHDVIQNKRFWQSIWACREAVATLSKLVGEIHADNWQLSQRLSAYEENSNIFGVPLYGDAPEKQLSGDWYPIYVNEEYDDVKLMLENPTDFSLKVRLQSRDGNVITPKDHTIAPYTQATYYLGVDIEKAEIQCVLKRDQVYVSATPCNFSIEE